MFLLSSLLYLAALVGSGDSLPAIGFNTVGSTNEYTVYDASVTRPTRVPGEIVWEDVDGSPACTRTAMVLVLPATSLPSGLLNASSKTPGWSTSTLVSSTGRIPLLTVSSATFSLPGLTVSSITPGWSTSTLISSIGRIPLLTISSATSSSLESTSSPPEATPNPLETRFSPAESTSVPSVFRLPRVTTSPTTPGAPVSTSVMGFPLTASAVVPSAVLSASDSALLVDLRPLIQTLAPIPAVNSTSTPLLGPVDQRRSSCTTTMTRFTTTTVTIVPSFQESETFTSAPAVGTVTSSIPTTTSAPTVSSLLPTTSLPSSITSSLLPSDPLGTDLNPVGEPNDGSGLFGVSYAPYRADRDCKTAEQMMNDFSRLKGKYSMVRIYGTDCNQIPIIYAAAKMINVRLFLGIWDINSVGSEAAKIIEGIDGDWDIVHTVSVGNELVNQGLATPRQVLDSVTQARVVLREGGYDGPVVTVDTFTATEAYPELCEESDYCAFNAHPYFDSTMSADQAGPWVANTIERVKSTLSKPMRVVVGETGWPTGGIINGKAIPGLKEQSIAIESIKSTFASTAKDIILFSAFNDPWKTEDLATLNADPHWGIGGAVSSSDEYLY